MIFRFLLFIAIWLLVDLYVFQAMKTVFTGPKAVYVNYAYWLFDIVLMIIIIYVGASGKMAGGPPKGGSYIMGLAILSLAPKIIVSPFLLIEDIVRLIQGGYVGIQKMRHVVSIRNQWDGNVLPARE